MSVADDVRALAGMVRDSAGAGERAAAHWARERLHEAGVADVALEPYRWSRTYAWTHLLHLLAGLSRRRAVRAAALASYALEAGGRLQWLGRVLPAGEGLNVVGRIPAAGHHERTLVLVAHLDAQRSGLMWDPRIVEAGEGRRRRTRAMSPAGLPAAVAIALGFRPLVLAQAAFLLDTASRATVPGANDNASGVAGVLELARRLAAGPLPGTEVVILLPGAEESGMGGMRAFLAAHRLDPAHTFVLGLDTVGSGTPILAAAEGAVLAHRYRDADLALVERGALAAGLGEPERWRVGGWTDPILARFAGLPSASLLSVGERGMYTHYHRMDDLPEHVDAGCVERCIAIAEGTARVFAEQSV
jgi:acetylornithine deacetylase/succinyl-diaminopimelate desuccinylase-like protein